MRALFQATLALPLLTIFSCQSVLTMGAYALSVVIPVAAPDLGVSPESIGWLVACVYFAAMLTGLASGRLLARLGPTRVFQLLLLLVSAGALVLGTGIVGAAVLGAVLIGCASGPMNPSGSSVLVRVAPTRLRALVFSLKQCGTPMGGMLAGTVLPALTLAYDWQTALWSIPAIAALVLLLAPFGGMGGRQSASPPPRSSPESPSKTQSGGVIKLLWSDPGLRAVTVYGFGLAVCQMALATYLVVYLWREAGYTPAQAGLVFAVLHIAGIVARVLLGALADRWMTTRWVLVTIGFVLAAGFVAVAAISSAWPLALVYVVMAVAGASGNGWVGLYFAELARLSPPGQVAEVAAGSQFATYLGIVCGPLLFSAMLVVLGGYGPSFIALAALSGVCGTYLAVAGR